MKHNKDCFRLLNEMIDCICSFSDQSKEELFQKAYTKLRNNLYNEYFTPFDREDIYMIAVHLYSLYHSLTKNRYKHESINQISPYLNKIKEIIILFDSGEKNKFRNIFKSITQYHNINTDDVFLNIAENEKSHMNDLIDKCNKTVIQIEYTILKNS